MSTIKVSTIAPLGTDATKTITVGASGDTFKLTDGITVSGAGANTPCFWVAKDATQAIAGDTQVQLTYEEELLDSAGAFASSTFTPQVAGYYFIYAQARFNSNSDADMWNIELYKNGSSVNVGSMVTRTQQTAQVSGLIQLNGSSDNVKFYVYHNLAGSNINVEDANNYTYAFGMRVIGI